MTVGQLGAEKSTVLRHKIQSLVGNVRPSVTVWSLVLILSTVVFDHVAYLVEIVRVKKSI